MALAGPPETARGHGNRAAPRPFSSGRLGYRSCAPSRSRCLRSRSTRRIRAARHSWVQNTWFPPDGTKLRPHSRQVRAGGSRPSGLGMWCLPRSSARRPRGRAPDAPAPRSSPARRCSGPPSPSGWGRGRAPRPAGARNAGDHRCGRGGGGPARLSTWARSRSR